MNNYIDDPVFGHMEYRHRWFKTDEYEMFGKKWTLTVAAKAYSGKPITDAERASYQKFQENQQETLALLSQKVTDYINNNLEELRFNWPAAKKVQDVSALSAIIMPRHFYSNKMERRSCCLNVSGIQMPVLLFKYIQIGKWEDKICFFKTDDLWL